MATKNVQRLDSKRKPMLRHVSADESVQELLVLLRSQEETPDEVLLNETKCLLSLSLDRNTMPPLPSIKSKQKSEQSQSSDEQGNNHAQKTTTNRREERLERTSTSSDDEVSDATQSTTFTPVSSANAKKHLPSLGSK